jgi:hypothetical protein
LDAGAGFLKPLGLFEHDDAKAVARQRQCCGQPADAGARDNDNVRRCQFFRSKERSGGTVVKHALFRPRRVRRQLRFVAVKRRAVGADIFAVLPHVAENVRMVERWCRAHAHECLGANFDDRDAGIVVKVGNDFIAHRVASRRAGMLAIQRHHTGKKCGFLAIRPPKKP